MKEIYYIETNLMCMALMFIGFNRLKSKDNLISASKNMLRSLAAATAVLCLSDVTAALVRGKMFAGAKIIIEISNMVYLESIICISLVWCTYVMYRTNIKLSKRNEVLLCMPFVIMTVLLLSNPFTDFVFSVNADNLYSRAHGVIVH